MTTVAALLALGFAQPAPKTLEFTIDGVRREALVYAPSKETGKPPLVFGFHGHGGNMRNAARSFQMREAWPEAVVVYMQGLPTSTRNDPKGARPGWQIMPSGQDGRDLKFFDAVLARMKKDHRVDERRIYAMGHSNGGRFSYVLWAERGRVFAAFGISGSPATGLLRSMSAKPAFLIAGESDPIVPFAGQKATFEALLSMNGCSAEGKSSGLLTEYKSKTGADISTYFHQGGHEYPRPANALMVDFFKKHAKP